VIEHTILGILFNTVDSNLNIPDSRVLAERNNDGGTKQLITKSVIYRNKENESELICS